MALTPMVLTARLLKQEEPDCKIVFVGPCAAKKLEASRKSVRSYVDFVLTFEEVKGMFDAKGVDFASLPEEEPLTQASSDGRGFAASGGVAAAVVKAVKRMDPDREVKVVSANGLQECKKDADGSQSREIQRISAGRHGVSWRLHSRCRNGADCKEGRSGTGENEERSVI